MRVVTPIESDEVIANPGMGWQTFHRFADEDPNLAGLPSRAAYFRFYWADIEPREKEIDFAKLDDLLAHARRAGQKLGIRIMCAASDRYYGSPAWLKEKGCKGYEYYCEGGGPFWVPDYDDPLFREAHFRLIRELGKRYDGHPDLDYVDIGSVGLWGEWHMSGTGVDMPPLETRLAIIDAYLDAFPRTPKLMLIGDSNGMAYATTKGAGWRADCLGDMGGFSPDWNHMRDAYPQEIQAGGAGEAWETAPVAWETCWDMRKWVGEGWDVCYIFDYALKYHGSYVNNKSAPLPDGSRPMVERLLRRLGYRLVLRRLEHPSTAARGGELPIAMHWENVGVAPPYRDYRLAFRLTSPGAPTTTYATEVSIEGWLPGRREVGATLPIGAALAAGSYTLSLAVVDPVTRAPDVKLAIQGVDDDGWYPLSQVEVTE
ncbi:MAG: DUF4832 domain-containing protein [Armatimonadota bacterium]